MQLSVILAKARSCSRYRGRRSQFERNHCPFGPCFAHWVLKMKATFASVVPVLMLASARQGQIQLYTLSQVTGTNGVIMSGLSTVLDSGSAHFESYATGSPAGASSMSV